MMNLEERKRGVGGSDAAAVCGLSKWRTPRQVYLEKTGQAETTLDNAAMFWGRTLEPVIRERYRDVTGTTTLVTPDKALYHKEHKFILANLDGMTNDRVVEIKTSRMSQGWGEEGTDQVPVDYLLQVQHYMLVTALPLADIAVLIGGSDFRVYKVKADAELQKLMIEKEIAFWEMVKRRQEPEPASYQDAIAKFGNTSSLQNTVQASSDIAASCERLRYISTKAKTLDDEKKILQAKVMCALGESDTLLHQGKTIATWKSAKPAKRLDQSALKEAEPDVYKRFLKAGNPQRRFLIK